jgi:GR25 family glycosyltransferase involved in LPS biosynthesis
MCSIYKDAPWKYEKEDVDINGLFEMKGFYINLDHRTDRKRHIEHQLEQIRMTGNITRFNAIKNANGRIGCSLSHLKCLENALKNEWDHVLICEDDITFLNPSLFISQLNYFLENIETKSWDVVLLGGNIIPPYQIINKSCVKVSKCQTTTGYIVQKHYIPTLIANIKEGVNNLIQNPKKHVIYAVDKYWFSLQQRDNWFLIIPLTVVQKPGYSDIEKKNTDYQNIMKDINKYYLKI